MRLIKFILAISFTTSLCVSCILEHNTSIDYYIINDSNSSLWMCWYHGGRDGLHWTDSVWLEKGEEYHTYYYEMGSWNQLPFGSPDSFVLKNNGEIHKVYFGDSGGKHPLDIDHYEGGKVEEKKRTSYYEYTYRILDDDLISNDL